MSQGLKGPGLQRRPSPPAASPQFQLPAASPQSQLLLRCRRVADAIPSIDLNADVGESFGAYTIGCDAAIIPVITSANIAAGFHGGDPSVIRQTVRLAKQHGVAAGAHPSLPDLAG